MVGRVDAQAGGLGEVLALQAVGVLVGATLPRRARVAKVDRYAEVCGDVGVPGHFDALVPGDRSDQVRGQGTHGRGDRDAQGVGVTGGKVHQSDQTGLALDEGADRRALVLADDEVTFPVPRLAAVGGSEWPLMDRQHRLSEPWATPARALVRAAVTPAGAQWAPVW